jgi:hypothetical protein
MKTLSPGLSVLVGLVGLVSLVMSASACASSPREELDPTFDVPHAASAPASALVADPSAVLGTWSFDLGSSDVVGSVRTSCARKGGNVEGKTRACLDAIAAQAAREKIRFGGDPAGRAVWTSFESDGATESVYVEAPVTLATDGPRHVLATIAGLPSGELAEQFVKSRIHAMRVEIVDARTIAVVDPEKGRLVYTKE